MILLEFFMRVDVIARLIDTRYYHEVRSELLTAAVLHEN